MTVTIKITDDRAKYDATRKRLRQLGKLSAYSGLHDPENATKGYRHEYGEGVPRRPWMGPSADGATPRLAGEAQRRVRGVADGDSPREAMKAIGDMLAAAMASTIERGQVGGDSLKDSTLRGKRDKRKLVDTGKMLRAIKAKVGRQDAED